MAHFTYIGGSLGSWATGTTVGSGKWWQLDQNQYKAINGDEGGTWTPTAKIVIGGTNGIEFASTPVLLSGTSTLTVGTGGITTRDLTATHNVSAANNITAAFASFDNTLNCGGALTIGGSAAIGTSATIGGDLAVTGNAVVNGYFHANGYVTLGYSSSDALDVRANATFDAAVGFNAAVTCSNVATFANTATFNGNARIYGVLDVRASGNLGYNKTHAISVLGTLTNDIEIVSMGGNITRNGDCASRIAITGTPSVSSSYDITFTATNAIAGSSKRIAYNNGSKPVTITDQTSGVYLGSLTSIGNSIEITFYGGRWWTS